MKLIANLPSIFGQHTQTQSTSNTQKLKVVNSPTPSPNSLLLGAPLLNGITTYAVTKRNSQQVSLTASSPFLPSTHSSPYSIILPLKHLLHTLLSEIVLQIFIISCPNDHYFLMVSQSSLMFLPSTTSLTVRIVSATERHGNRNYVMCPPKTFSYWFWVQVSLSHWQNSFALMSKLNT